MFWLLQARASTRDDHACIESVLCKLALVILGVNRLQVWLFYRSSDTAFSRCTGDFDSDNRERSIKGTALGHEPAGQFTKGQQESRQSGRFSFRLWEDTIIPANATR